MTRIVIALLLLAAPAATPQAAISDEALWAHFEKWVSELKALPPGQTVGFEDAYAASFAPENVSREEANRRFERISKIRRGSVDRERTYWNGAFKLGRGPSSPLRLLQEAILKVKPGRALDAGMGRGRNTIYLAANGWDTAGYDMAGDALDVAQAAAKEAGVKITTTRAKHEEFDFGESKWDLIVCAYCYMMPDETRWPGVFWKALRPGGLVVFQTSVGGQPSWSKLSENWKQFHILRLEDQDPGYIDDDWAPSRTNRTVRLVARKE